MGQKVVLTCDLHGDNTEAADTMRFSVDGASYAVELCEKHLKEFNDKLAPFVKASRRAGGRPRASASTRRSPRAAASAGRGRRSRTADVASIREWARSQGYEVSDRGRLSAALFEAYAKAGGR
jgi:hypothetical protein